MADTFTVNIIRCAGNDSANETELKTYLDTLTAANIDAITCYVEGHTPVYTIISHA